MEKQFILPNDLVIFISGVPGVGKTTLSYELLKKYKEFRLIEETDVIREVLRGYNQFLEATYQISVENIYSHNIFLSYKMAREQCIIMKNSIINIVMRQQRKKIPSIINGVHIIPEELYLSIPNSNVLYINLYIDSENHLWDRLKFRNHEKYVPECVPFLYETNNELHKSIKRIPRDMCSIYSINVSNRSIKDTISEIDNIFFKEYKK